MNIAYPISEILKCVEIINQSEKKYYKSDDKTFNLNNNLGMKKKIIQTEGTFGELIETEKLLEETFDDAEPFEIDEITKVANEDDSQSTKEKTEEKKSFAKIHDDEEDTTRIGRSGDPLEKIKKI